jgi:nucleoside permease NupC
MKKLKIIRLFSALIVACIFIPVDSFAQSNEASKSKKQTTYKKARVLQTKTAKEMAKFYEAYERVKL